MNQRFAVDGVEARSPLSEAAAAILESKAGPLFDLEDAASGGADMDAVHDMRVASRRLREAMRLLRPLYPPRDFDAWYKRVRRITRALGPVRDSDVFIDAFAKMGRGLGEGGKRAVAFMVGFRMGQRERELDALQAVLGKLDLAESRRSFSKLAASPRKSAEAKRPLADFAHAAVAERSGIVFGMMPPALEEENVHVQHELRIAFKRLRYAVEVFAPCYADEFDPIHDTLTAFQDTLGDMHDIHVFLDMVREPARVEAAGRAGVSADDLGEVATLLEKRAHREFLRFEKLAAENPAGDLLSALLLPLSRLPEPEEAPAASAEAEVAVEPAPGLAEPATASPEPAVVAEPPAIVEPSRPVPGVTIVSDGEPLRILIEPPVVIGAEPWATPTTPAAPAPAPAAAAPDAPAGPEAPSLAPETPPALAAPKGPAE